MKKYLRSFIMSCIVLALGFSVFFQSMAQTGPIDGGILADPTQKAQVFCARITSTAVAPGLYSARVVVGFTKRVYYKPNAAYPTKDTIITYTKTGNTGNFPTFYVLAGATSNAVLFTYVPKSGDGVPASNMPSLYPSQNESSDLSFVKGQAEIMLLKDDGTKYYQEGIDWSKLSDADLPVCQFPNTGGDGSFRGVIDQNGGFPGLLGDNPQSPTPICPSGTTGTWPNCSSVGGGPTCFDGIQNQGETGVDTGGPCSSTPSPSLGTCSDTIKNGNETGVDSGGRCAGGEIGEIGPGSSNVAFGHYFHNSILPVKISVIDNLPAMYSQYLPKAIKDLNMSPSVLMEVGGSNSITIPITSGYYNTNWVGVTNVGMNGVHLAHMPVRLNDKYLLTAQYNKPEEHQYTVTHELGHAIGLEHQDTTFCNQNKGSVMDYTAAVLGGMKNCGGSSVNFGINNMHLNQRDINALSQAYAHD